MALNETKELFEKFRTQWQCFACKIPPGPQQKNRYLCLTMSHPLCEMCNVECPCGASVASNPCEFLAQMVDNFQIFHCCNYENGCREILIEADYEEHLQKCIFREVYCPSLRLECNAKIIFKDVDEHTRDKHKITPIRITDKEIRNDWPWFATTASHPIVFGPNQIISKDERTFYFVGYTKANSSLTYFWMYFVGSQDEAKNYEYELSFSNVFQKQSVTFRSQPHSLDRNFKDIIDEEEAFLVSDKTLNRFKVREKTELFIGKVVLQFRLKIRCLKDEAKDDDVESGVSEGETEQEQPPLSKFHRKRF